MKYTLAFNELNKFFSFALSKADFEKEDLLRLNGRSQAVKPEAVRRLFVKKSYPIDFQIVAHLNLRGGIGKTTSSVSLASRAAQFGYKTCLLDLDPQASASLAFNRLPQEDEPVFYDIWQKPDELLMPALKEIQKGFYILPSSLENAMLDSSLMNPRNLKKAVADVCNTLKINQFDLIVIDCPPALGAATISTVCAAHQIVIPVWSDLFSFKGLELSLTEIDSICDTFQIPKPEIKILYSKYDKREKISTEAYQKLQKKYPQYLLPTYIRTSSEFNKAFERHESIFANKLKNNAKQDYDAYAKAILKNL